MSIPEANRWLQIEEIFHGVLQRSAAERDAYLAQVCGGDTFLLDEVTSLISSHEVNDEFLAQSQLSSGLNLLAELDTVSRAGETVGRYRLKERIGRGGMGDVYLAQEKDLDRNVALKLLPPSFNSDPEWIARFRHEARAASRISHPQVAHVYEVGESEGRHFIAMEYIEGVTLRERIGAAPIEPIEAVNIAIQIARALSAAHAEGVSHRDIKPENIMIHRDGYLKVLDFGLAKLTGGVGFRRDGQPLLSSIATAPGVILGSPAYMSPEQARGKEVDPRTDLWSLGIVLYELLTRKCPFLSETPSDTIAAILKTEPLPPSQLVPGLPTKLDRIVYKLLAKDAAGRYQSAEAVIDDLVAVSQDSFVSNDGRSYPSSIAAPLITSGAAPAKHETPPPNRMIASLTSAAVYTQRVVKRSKWHLLALALISVVVVGVLVTVKKGNPAAPIPAKQAITSIAVLPFVNTTGDPEMEYVSDGLSENLIGRFSRLSRLKVVAQGSSFQYKGKTAEPKTIAKELDVQAIVSGNVTREGDDLVIVVVLNDPNRTELRWTQLYRYKFTDLARATDDISRQLATNLDLDLTGAELNLVASSQVADGTAHEWYMKGRFFWNQLTRESLDKSIECFKQAIKIEPNYALAYAGMADAHLTLGANFRSGDVEFPLAESNAQKAMQLNERLAEAHYALAAIKYVYYWDLDGAELALDRSFELKPNFAAARSLKYSIHLTRGESTQARAELNHALELDPLSLLYNTQLYYLLYTQRDYVPAERQFQRLLKQDSTTGYIHSDLALLYSLMGRTNEAQAESDRAIALTGPDADSLAAAGIVHARAGNSSQARKIIRRLEQMSQKKFVKSYFIAAIYSSLGDKDLAFEWLDQAVKQRAAHLLRLRVDPAFDAIRSDRRFDALVNEVNLN